jgi:hypothetical protein
VKVQQIGVPPLGAHWSYGADYMRRITEPAARKLCEPHPLPRMGYETDVKVVKDMSWPSFTHHLEVQNISGHFYLASCSVPVLDWPKVFDVELSPLKGDDHGL